MPLPGAAHTAGALEMEHRSAQRAGRLSDVRRDHGHRLAGMRPYRLVQPLGDAGDLSRRSPAATRPGAARCRRPRRGRRRRKRARDGGGRGGPLRDQVRADELLDLLLEWLGGSRAHAAPVADVGDAINPTPERLRATFATTECRTWMGPPHSDGEGGREGSGLLSRRPFSHSGKPWLPNGTGPCSRESSDRRRRRDNKPHVLLPSAFCLLPFAFCLLPSAFCLLPFAFCLLPSASASNAGRSLARQEPCCWHRATRRGPATARPISSTPANSANPTARDASSDPAEQPMLGMQ